MDGWIIENGIIIAQVHGLRGSLPTGQTFLSLADAPGAKIGDAATGVPFAGEPAPEPSEEIVAPLSRAEAYAKYHQFKAHVPEGDG